MPDYASSLFSFFDDSDGFWFTKPRWKALPNVKREAAAKGKKYSTYKPISFLLLHSSCMSYSFCSRFSHEEQWDHCLPTPTQHRQYVETRRKRREKTHTVSYMHNHKPCTTLERGVYTPSYTNESPLLSLTLREKSSEGKFEKTEEKKKWGQDYFFPSPILHRRFPMFFWLLSTFGLQRRESIGSTVQRNNDRVWGERKRQWQREK